MKVEREVAQSCLTLHDPMDCSTPGSSVHGILQARALEWGAIAEVESSFLKKKQRIFVVDWNFEVPDAFMSGDMGIILDT